MVPVHGAVLHAGCQRGSGVARGALGDGDAGEFGNAGGVGNAVEAGEDWKGWHPSDL